jgi:hypothetical protein
VRAPTHPGALSPLKRATGRGYRRIAHWRSLHTFRGFPHSYGCRVVDSVNRSALSGDAVYARHIVHIPTSTNPTPAAYERYFGSTYCDTRPPAATPTKVVVTRAKDAARNTVYRLAGVFEAKSSVASCVLSPSSAKKIVPKTVAKSLISIFKSHFYRARVAHAR